MITCRLLIAELKLLWNQYFVDLHNSVKMAKPHEGIVIPLGYIHMDW